HRLGGSAVSARPSSSVERVALRWPDEVASALGVSRSWLYKSGLAAELRFLRHNKVRLVAVRELERVIEKLSARWEQGTPRHRILREEGRATRERPRPRYRPTKEASTR